MSALTLVNEQFFTANSSPCPCQHWLGWEWNNGLFNSDRKRKDGDNFAFGGNINPSFFTPTYAEKIVGKKDDSEEDY